MGNGLDRLGGYVDDENISLYGIGVSYIQAVALSVTFGELLDITGALYYVEPIDNQDYFIYIYYLNLEQCLRAYKIYSHYFAIVSPMIYENEMNIKELADILSDTGEDY